MKATVPQVVTVTVAIIMPCLAQNTFTPLSCIQGSPVTAFPACIYLTNTINKCAGPDVGPGAPFINCMCNQELFNSYYDCDSEERLCVGNSDVDGSIQLGINQWHSICDGNISFSPTTPVVSSVTTSFNPQNCLTAEAACANAANSNSACSSSYAGKSEIQLYSSCLCEPEILSMSYSCLYLGNISCQITTAALSNILPAYTFCKNFASVLGGINATTTGPNSQSATVTAVTTNTVSSTVSNSPSSLNTQSITQPPLPGPSTSNLRPTSTKSSVGVLAQIPRIKALLAFWVTLLIALIMFI
ncbi:hypothetical protein N431DRAFT_475440 [Stipitochalara longipes BDJ]|nr:hypothetical protein N431DRAFT_475440 [Stipitochalara longipes BDJ]